MTPTYKERLKQILADLMTAGRLVGAKSLSAEKWEHEIYMAESAIDTLNKEMIGPKYSHGPYKAQDDVRDTIRKRFGISDE